MLLGSNKTLKAYAVDTAGNVGPVITENYLLNINIALTKGYDNGSGSASGGWYWIYMYLNDARILEEYDSPEFPLTWFITYGPYTMGYYPGFQYRFQVMATFNAFDLHVINKETGIETIQHFLLDEIPG